MPSIAMWIFTVPLGILGTDSLGLEGGGLPRRGGNFEESLPAPSEVLSKAARGETPLSSTNRGGAGDAKASRPREPPPPSSASSSERI
eukprot:4281723-Pyramimonas_sp.AAC.1